MVDDTLTVFKVNSCPACNSTTLENFMNRQVVCCDCGLVIDSEIRGDNYVRSTDGSRQATGKRLTAVANQHENDFSEWQKLLKVSDSTERNAAIILYYITKIVRKLQLPFSILEKSVNIYRTLIDKCSFKGMRLRAASAAIVYASCKIAEIPCSIREVASILNEDSRKVFRIYSTIAEHLEVPPTQSNISKLLHQICEVINVKELPRNIANKIIDIIGKTRITQGKNPYSCVAAAIYISSILVGRKKTQRELSKITHVTEASIRTRYKEIIQNLLFTISI
jgi:transcription initiation factor TFIIB